MDVAGPSTSDVSDISDVPTRLGISINLSSLQRQPSTPATSSISFRDTASSVGPFMELVGPAQPLPSTATAIDFLGKRLMTTFVCILLNRQICMLGKNVLHHTSGKT